ncbi:MAG: integrin alpha [Pseudomonadota bacterium]|jgi:hypothetical protein
MRLHRVGAGIEMARLLRIPAAFESLLLYLAMLGLKPSKSSKYLWRILCAPVLFLPSFTAPFKFRNHTLLLVTLLAHVWIVQAHSEESTSVSDVVLVGQSGSEEPLGVEVVCANEASRPEDDGHSLAVLAIGAAGAQGGVGRVYIYQSSTYLQTLEPESDLPVARFGSAMGWIDDINGDLVDDLIVGAPGSAGRIDGGVYAFTSRLSDGRLKYSLCGALQGPSGLGERMKALRRGAVEGSANLIVADPLSGRIDGFILSTDDQGLCTFSALGEFIIPSTEGDVSPLFIEADVQQSEGLVVAGGGDCGVSLSSEYQGGAGFVGLSDRGTDQDRFVIGLGTPQMGWLQLTPPPLLTPTPTAPPTITHDPNNGGGKDPTNPGGDSIDPTPTVAPPFPDPLAVAPDSIGLPAPVIISKGKQIEVRLPNVTPQFSAAQRAALARRLQTKHKISRKKALELISNPDNINLTYIVRYAEVAAATRFAFIQSAYAQDEGGAASKARQIRSRRNSVTIRNLSPGLTYRISYRVEISLKQPRVILGTTQRSASVTFRAVDR